MRNMVPFLLILSLLAMPVFAAEEKTAPTAPEAIEKNIEPNPDDFPVLKKLQGTSKKTSYDYLGKRFNMDAWLLSGPDLMQVVYINPTSEGALVGGALIGPDGKEVSSELTHQFMEQYPERAQEILITVRKLNKKEVAALPETPATNSPSEILWQRLQQSGKIRFGAKKDAPVLFAILDPIQPASKKFWAKVKPLLDQQKITLYVLPLGMTSADSLLEIATTLGSKDPAGDWEKLMRGETTVRSEPPENSGALGMKANVELAQSLKLQDVPFLVYRGKTDKIRIVRGNPKNWTPLLQDLQVQ